VIHFFDDREIPGRCPITNVPANLGLGEGHNSRRDETEDVTKVGTTARQPWSVTTLLAHSAATDENHNFPQDQPEVATTTGLGRLLTEHGWSQLCLPIQAATDENHNFRRDPKEIATTNWVGTTAQRTWLVTTLLAHSGRHR
jgi:hypothetical protein